MAAVNAMDDTDLSDLTPQEAREYVLAFVTSLKTLSRQMEQLSQEIETWRGRRRLAEEKSAAELAARAATILASLEDRHAALELERQELARKVETLKRNLQRLEVTGTRLVDTDLLQAELDMAVGEETAAAQATDRAISDAQAQTALEELKKKLGGGGSA